MVMTSVDSLKELKERKLKSSAQFGQALFGLYLYPISKVGTASYGFGECIYSAASVEGDEAIYSRNPLPSITNYPAFFNSVADTGKPFFSFRIIENENGNEMELADTYHDKHEMDRFIQLQENVKEAYEIHQVDALEVVSDTIMLAIHRKDLAFLIKYLKLLLHPQATLSMLGTLQMDLLFMDLKTQIHGFSGYSDGKILHLSESQQEMESLFWIKSRLQTIIGNRQKPFLEQYNNLISH